MHSTYFWYVWSLVIVHTHVKYQVIQFHTYIKNSFMKSMCLISRLISNWTLYEALLKVSVEQDTSSLYKIWMSVLKRKTQLLTLSGKEKMWKNDAVLIEYENLWDKWFFFSLKLALTAVSQYSGSDRHCYYISDQNHRPNFLFLFVFV